MRILHTLHPRSRQGGTGGAFIIFLLSISLVFGAEQNKLVEYESLHFKINTASYEQGIQIADISERIYQKIMFDTNLFSFKPKENYQLTVYPTPLDYYQQTGLPVWSGGAAITEPLGNILPSEKQTKARTKIYTFEDAVSAPLLAHEITHLIFNEFMETEISTPLYTMRWLNEGLATYEELQAYLPEDRKEFLSVIRPILRDHSMSLEDVIKFVPSRQSNQEMGRFFYRGKNQIYSSIQLWYWQVGSIVEFLIQQYGSYNFYLFLSALKQNKDLLTALGDAYPGRWRTLSDLESEWKGWL